jgi:predicted nucleotidyltransferase
MLLDIKPNHLKELEIILNKYVADCAVFAFGSRIKGTARQYSDLDLCIKGKEPLGLKRFSELQDAFSESNIPYKVDIIDWHTISESFRQIIEENKVILKA